MMWLWILFGGIAVYALGVISVYVACADDPEFYKQFNKRVQNLKTFMEGK